MWTYDNAGNILYRTRYDYTTGTLGSIQETFMYTYGDLDWGDLLTAVNDQMITYDEIGNPLEYYNGYTFTWENGRRLSSINTGSSTWNMTYDASGMRTSRVGEGKYYRYAYTGGLLRQMTVGSEQLDFTYDANGVPLSVAYCGSVYHYVTNLQGDVIAIVDDEGSVVVEYSYDTWGNLLSINTTDDINAAEIILAIINPLRYRGYVYDSETGFYYLQSRYYDPNIGRFINADAFASTGQGILGNNMFAYCGNNPVARSDDGGYVWETVFDIVSLGISVIEVCINPSDLWAWVGLAGDAVDLIPFVTGIGEISRGLRITSDVMETADSVHDTLNIADNSADALTTLYRSVSKAEAEDILTTGRFNLPFGGMESKQFGFDLDETRQFGKMVGQNQIVSATIPTNMLNQFYTGGVDTSIFRKGTLTVYGDQLDVFNQVIRGTIKFIP